MTQALNLANFANNLNTSGATTNAGLQNSSVTVTAGTGMSGGGAVALGSSVTLTNAGVTSVTGAGTVTVSASTGAVTITGGGGTGTVTSVATGNGLAGGTITTSGTLTLGNVGWDTVGCCANGLINSNLGTVSPGGTFGGSTLRVAGMYYEPCVSGMLSNGVISTLSGTYRYLGIAQGGTRNLVAVRIA